MSRPNSPPSPAPTLAPRSPRFGSPRAALILLLTINLFNYVDRQILAAVLPRIQDDLHASNEAMGRTATAFLVSYMLLAPLFGWLADRFSRWLLIAVGIALWSLASGATGLAGTMTALILTRCFVGVGEAAYGPVAPTVLSDLYPVAQRGRILSWFYLAIPVGSALGYILGGIIASVLSWRWAFWLVVPPGLALAVWSILMPDPPRGKSDRIKPDVLTPSLAPSPGNPGEGWGDGPNSISPELRPAPARATRRDYLNLLKNKSFVLDTLGMTAMTFAMGGVGFWMPTYVARAPRAPSLATTNIIFGAIVVVAGLVATLAGGMAGDKLTARFPGAYFLVSAGGMFIGFPMFVLMLFTPFPFAWIFIFLGCFFLFSNTGPTNAILANVTHPSIRATAFSVNILIIHAFGDAISPLMIGAIADRYNLRAAFLVVSLMMVLGGTFWLFGAKHLACDTGAAPLLLSRT